VGQLKRHSCLGVLNASAEKVLSMICRALQFCYKLPEPPCMTVLIGVINVATAGLNTAAT